jgi:hypothetical protein
VRVSYCGKFLRTSAAGFGDQPVWDEVLSFSVLSDEALGKLGLDQHLPFQKIYVEVWERGLFGSGSLVGGFEVDPSLIAYNERCGPSWGRLTHATRAVEDMKRHFGSIRYCVSWGSAERTSLRVHVEEVRAALPGEVMTFQLPIFFLQRYLDS